MRAVIADTPILWLAFVASFPVLLRVYFPVVLRIFRALALPQQAFGFYQHYLYAGFAFAMGLPFLHVAPVEVPLGVEPWYLALVPVGVGLYYLDTYAWATYKGKSVRGGTVPPVAILPVFLVPFPEEVLFRAGLAPLLGAVGPAGYVVASGVAFGLIHLGFGTKDVVLKTVNGALYALVFLATGSVLTTVAVHVGYNVASFHVLADYDVGLSVWRPGAGAN